MPTRAVAKVITECIIKTKMQLVVCSAEPTLSTEVLHPWGWDAMALTTMRAPIADDERIPQKIADHDARGAWAAALVASAKAGGSPARCVSRSDCFVVTSIGIDDTVLFDLDTYINEANTSTGLANEPFDMETVTTKGKRQSDPMAL